jgi:hypothetical protein
MVRHLSANDFLELGLVHVGLAMQPCCAAANQLPMMLSGTLFSANPLLASCWATFSNLKTIWIKEEQAHEPCLFLDDDELVYNLPH